MIATRAPLPAAIFFALVPGRASAGDAEQARAEATLAERVAAANEACKSSIETTIQWSSLGGKIDEAAAGAHCGEVMDTIGSYCRRSERHQLAVAAALESVTCRHDPKATREHLDKTDVSWKLKKKAATVGYSTETRDIDGLRRLHFEFAFLRNGGPGEEEFWNNTLRKDHVEPAEASCQKKLKVEIDWPSFRGKYELESGSQQTAENVFETCKGIVGTIQDWCDAEGDAAPRARAVKKGIDRLTCTWDKKATWKKLNRPGASHKLKAKHFVVGWSWETQNPGQEVNDFFIVKFKIVDPHRAKSGPCKGKSGAGLLNCMRKGDWKRCDDNCGGDAKCKKTCKVKWRVRLR